MISVVVLGALGAIHSLGDSAEEAIVGRDENRDPATQVQAATLNSPGGALNAVGGQSAAANQVSPVQLQAAVLGSPAGGSGSPAQGFDAFGARGSAAGLGSLVEGRPGGLVTRLSGFLGQRDGASLVLGAGAVGRGTTSENAAGSTSETTRSAEARRLAEARGAVFLEIEKKRAEMLAVRNNDDLDDDVRDAFLDALEQELEDLQRWDDSLEEARVEEELSLRDVVTTLVDALLPDHLESRNQPLENRLDDRETLARLAQERADLVSQIEALRQSGASREEYEALQRQLAELDAEIGELLARDHERLERRHEEGAEIVLSPLELELKAVGPDAGDPAAVDAYLRKPPAGVSADQLQAIMPNIGAAEVQQYAPLLNTAMAEAGINTPQRRAAFLAQLAHESGGLMYFEELASGAAYEWRTDLGNTQAGDGVRYKGRGPIQLTGRANYRTAGQALGLDLEGNPTQAATPEVGFRIAAWYWESRGLNELADAGNFDQITYRINGGYNGAQDRIDYWELAKTVLY